MTPAAGAQFLQAAVLFGIAYMFWLTYRDPDKNRMTRFLNSYIERTRFPLIEARASIMAIVIVTLAVAVMTLAFLIRSLASTAR
jgi:hypothetical protein